MSPFFFVVNVPSVARAAWCFRSSYSNCRCKERHAHADTRRRATPLCRGRCKVRFSRCLRFLELCLICHVQIANSVRPDPGRGLNRPFSAEWKRFMYCARGHRTSKALRHPSATLICDARELKLRLRFGNFDRPPISPTRV